jgi:WD40 repeat protein
MNIVDKEYLLKSIICSLSYIDYRSLVYKLNHRKLFTTLTKFQISLKVKKLILIKSECKIVYDDDVDDDIPKYRILRMVLLKDNKLATNGNRDNIISIWETKGGLKRIKLLSEHTVDISILFVLQDNNLLSICYQRVMIIWHHSDFTILHKIQNSAPICYITQNSLGQLITGQLDGTIHILEPRKDFEIVNNLLGHGKMVLNILPLSNGDLVSSYLDLTIRFWDSKSNYACIRFFKFVQGSVKMNVGDNDLVAAYADSQVMIFDQKENYSKKIILDEYPSRRSVSILKFLQNKYLAFGYLDGSIMILSKLKGNILYSPKEHDATILFLYVHKNNILISGSRDKKIILRDMGRNFRTIAIIYLEMNSALVLENRIPFSELDSLNIII